MSAMRIPGLVDVLTVEEPEEIRRLSEHPALDRVAEGGPLAVRLLRTRLARTLRSPDGPLPSAMPRDSAEREKLRKDLFAQLADPDLAERLEEPVAKAAAYVSGKPGRAGPLAQTLFGKVFVPGFVATDSSWNAAQVIGRAAGAPTPISMWEAITGQRTAAQATLSQVMKGDRNGVHAIGVAVHNFVLTLERLRRLDKSTGTEEALAKSILAPERVARSGVISAETVAGGVRKSTFVLLSTRKAATKTLDRRLAFLTDAWSGCPAHDFVPALTERIWRAAQEQA
ncbi:MAG: hypothetical protein AAFQ66_21110 [Pseudomonadota bacterium]